MLNILRRLVRGRPNDTFDSARYWEARYAAGGDSGAGSYGGLAEFKAEVLNAFVAENGIKSVIEFGSGDGNQIKLARYPAYIGLDVSVTAIERCRRQFEHDTSKSFYLYSPFAFVDHARLFHADLALSIDVLYHLIEQDVFELHLSHLFNAADRYVIIYSWGPEVQVDGLASHNALRPFARFVEANNPEWTLVRIVKNKHPYEPATQEGSLCDFFVYERAGKAERLQA